MTELILPGATLGVLGGGQLGRMFTQAARTLGYRVMVLDPDPTSPAGTFADYHLQAEYTDPQALQRLGHDCAAITTEWESVPATTLETLSAYCPVRPSADAVAVARDRIREKVFVHDLALPTANFYPIRSRDDLATAVAGLRLPALLKTATLGYDGKGQRLVQDLAQAERAFVELGERPCVLEEKVDLALELSIILVRAQDGAMQTYPVAENVHRNGILHISRVPANITPALAEQARDMAQRIATALDYVGILALEFFLTQRGELLINEMAPRPHNSGHYTLDACSCSQFEQQVRTLCGLPLGSTRLLTPVTMLNLLGDLWNASAPNWQAVFALPEAKLHLYGKQHARPGRKMGHVNLLCASSEQGLQLAEQLFQSLRKPPVA